MEPSPEPLTEGVPSPPPPHNLERVRKLAEGEHLFHEGDLGTKLYLLLEGTLALSKRREGGGLRVVENVAAGEFVGESALLDYPPRPVTATAASACRLLELPGAFLADLIAARPQEARRLVESLARRLNSSFVDLATADSERNRGDLRHALPATAGSDSSTGRSPNEGGGPSVDWHALAKALTDPDEGIPLGASAAEAALLTPLPTPGSGPRILRPRSPRSTEAVDADDNLGASTADAKTSWWSSPAALITMAALVTALAVVGLWLVSNGPG